MAKIGEQLLQPESGWQRIDDSDSHIKYIGTWTAITDYSAYYNSTYHYSSTINANIRFSFYGTKLRLISDMYTDRNVNGIKLIIDDVEYSFTEYYSAWVCQIIVYEKTDLEEGIHNVEIINTVAGKYLMLDCIDIDEDGYLLTEEEYNKYTNSNFIKTDNNIISDDTYSLDSDLLDLRDNYHGMRLSNLSNKIKDIDEDYRIIKIKK